MGVDRYMNLCLGCNSEQWRARYINDLFAGYYCTECWDKIKDKRWRRKDTKKEVIRNE